MTFVVTEPCRDCKYTDCVTVCPTDAFFQDERMLYIDPESCIDCGACAPECPVGAIYGENEVPSQWTQYIALNAERVLALKIIDGANITQRQEPLGGAHCSSQ
jgi:ferredoxin